MTSTRPGGTLGAVATPRRRRLPFTVRGLLIGLFLVTAGIAVTQEVVPAPDASKSTGEQPEWIPVGSVPPEVERRALQTQTWLQSRSPVFQRQALGMIQEDIARYGRATMRIAAVPLVVDLLGEEYRILQTPTDYSVDPIIRLQALGLLATLGGDVARKQLRDSLSSDDDASVRAGAAHFLAAVPGSTPDEDFQAVGDALQRAVRRGAPEEEIVRLLIAARELSTRTWNAEYAPLLDALVGIASSGYSSSTRNRAMSFLDALSER